MILLDTHIWIWSNAEPARIPTSIAAHLQANPHQLCISSISIWEMILLAERGKINVGNSPASLAERWIEGNPVEVIAIDRQIATLSQTLSFSHADPADRFIGATCHLHGCTLATMDAHLRSLPWLETVQ